jgi:hypothetical protein
MESNYLSAELRINPKKVKDIFDAFGWINEVPTPTPNDLISKMSTLNYQSRNRDELIDFDYDRSKSSTFNRDVFEDMALFAEPGANYQAELDNDKVYVFSIDHRFIKKELVKVDQTTGCTSNLEQEKSLLTEMRHEKFPKIFPLDQPSFPYVINTSNWKTKDKGWVLERKAQWETIEPMLVGPKSGKGKTAIKQYFLKGKMPDWDKFRDWNNSERHLDLFMFVWLHPSWNENLLSQLRDAYISSDEIVLGDVSQGFGILLSWGTVRACQDYTDRSDEWPHCLHTHGHNELLFKILMSNLEKHCYELEFLDRGLGREKRKLELPKSDLGAIFSMAKWLSIRKMLPINNDMLFQYDLPLEWWYQSVKNIENSNAFRFSSKKPYFEKALYRIHHFDTDKEGDTCRTRFVQKMRKMLDEREFMPEFKQVWSDVKTGKVELEDPWGG